MSRSPSSVPHLVVDELTHIPPQRAAAIRLLDATQGSEAGSRQVADVLAHDPAMTARVLQMANAAAFGMEPVSSVTDAVTRVGFSVIRALAVGWASGAFSQTPTDADWFWPHSLAVAGISSELARQEGLQVGTAWSAGLLHDLGQVLLLRLDSTRYRRLVARMGVDTLELRAAERRLYGSDHGQLLAAGLGGWGLDPDLVDAVRTHHDVPQPRDRSLAAILQVAELVAGTLLEPDAPDRRARAVAGLDRTPFRVELDELVEVAHTAVASGSGLLDAIQRGR